MSNMYTFSCVSFKLPAANILTFPFTIKTTLDEI